MDNHAPLSRRHDELWKIDFCLVWDFYKETLRRNGTPSLCDGLPFKINNENNFLFNRFFCTKLENNKHSTFQSVKSNSFRFWNIFKIRFTHPFHHCKHCKCPIYTTLTENDLNFSNVVYAHYLNFYVRLNCSNWWMWLFFCYITEHQKINNSRGVKHSSNHWFLIILYKTHRDYFIPTHPSILNKCQT